MTPLKALQGLIWEEGYRRGDFRGHVMRTPPAICATGMNAALRFMCIHPVRFMRKNCCLDIAKPGI